MSKLDKMFSIDSSLSPIAETVPSSTISKEDIRWSIPTKKVRCLICNSIINKTYHIHKTLVKQTTNNKRQSICSG